jgi:hypothetical protein
LVPIRDAPATPKKALYIPEHSTQKTITTFRDHYPQIFHEKRMLIAQKPGIESLILTQYFSSKQRDFEEDIAVPH